MKLKVYLGARESLDILFKATKGLDVKASEVIWVVE